MGGSSADHQREREAALAERLRIEAEAARVEAGVERVRERVFHRNHITEAVASVWRSH